MNCKPGDLAYVTWAAPEISDAIGRIVEVLNWNSHYSAWNIEFAGKRPPSLYGYATLSCNDDWLRPISGVPVHDEVTEEITA
jgi:hypothetical protein